MADFSWNIRSPLERALVAGRYGAPGEAGVSLTEIRNFDLVQVMARRGKAAETVNAAKARFGVAAPETPKAADTADATLIWSGPDQFLVLSRGGGQRMETLARVFAGLASLSDQSHARALISVSGDKARTMLAKLSSIDLHPEIFPVGTAAATSIDHTSVTLWRGKNRQDGQAVFNLLVFATFAESLWHTMLDSAAEYGVTVAHSEELA
ncbi:sarcosine oxidase subunit gamma [Mesorhizobium sp. M1A.F.Ca.IN.022.07.1.1]|uniref:sarcosine oxidase subunit gamma n=1 Tax=unclassified Mesorhizobium TaxID=325217 RepID=UPI000BB02365|nr:MULTISPECIES: sarcosine oxidase subunit gamma family protein [unclassified Mesorhizobium]TGV86557.1 sarcosine oxidase subunit gamma [Mesorhizobium sp. M00.F.Ca.ET.158.01.1.1]AZO59237.1 sarcosine oxidase subunit gamma [Mesorhizobium sp. M1A.F.Ca.IN.022.06.1.1]MCT2578044.1 sarcosine oxidase subunit gamma [Mesorhizobium sp. P13.3]MDF3166982.1 sarcosine oxidase subunit gamma family protein [Mesorhizobium sp. P16.1]MDF3177511.1 sarcosine oxidase subunit gamma family protein [Mesorhizobium sp. P1